MIAATAEQRFQLQRQWGTLGKLLTAERPVDEVDPASTPRLLDWRPTEVQQIAMASDVDELFFGGARGGGKSDMLIADFASHAKEFGQQAIGLLVRKTFKEFQPLLDKARRMYHGHATYNSTNAVWTFHNGARLFMGYLNNMNDVSRYMGAEYTWQGFDELPEWPASDEWEFMGSCMRSTGNVPKLRRGTGNPGRPGHGWVKAYFIDIAEYGEVWTDPDTGRTRLFIPSRLDDNPHLMHNDDYVRQLMALNPILRRAFLDGDWDVFLGQAFPEWNRDQHVISARTFVDPSWPKWSGLDWGTNKPYAMLFFTATPGGHIWITRESYGQKVDSKTYNVGTHESAPSVAKREWLATRGTGCDSCIFDQSMKAEHGHGFSLASAFENEGWTMIPSIRNRLNGKASVHSLLQTRCSDGYPVLQVFGENCPHFLRTFPALPYATTGKNANEDVDTDAEDHLYDALQYVASSGITTDMMMHIDADRDGLAAVDEAENAKIWSTGWQHRLN